MCRFSFRFSLSRFFQRMIECVLSFANEILESMREYIRYGNIFLWLFVFFFFFLIYECDYLYVGRKKDQEIKVCGEFYLMYPIIPHDLSYDFVSFATILQSCSLVILFQGNIWCNFITNWVTVKTTIHVEKICEGERDGRIFDKLINAKLLVEWISAVFDRPAWP